MLTQILMKSAPKLGRGLALITALAAISCDGPRSAEPRNNAYPSTPPKKWIAGQIFDWDGRTNMDLQIPLKVANTDIVTKQEVTEEGIFYDTTENVTRYYVTLESGNPFNRFTEDSAMGGIKAQPYCRKFEVSAKDFHDLIDPRAQITAHLFFRATRYRRDTGDRPEHKYVEVRAEWDDKYQLKLVR